MTDIVAITSLIGSVKTGIEIVKTLKETNKFAEQAETKIKIAELIEALADSKIKASEIKELIEEKDKRIQELEEALELKAKLVRHKDAYYEMNENGMPFGVPFCTHCWEAKHKAIHLHHVPLSHHWICSNCKNEFSKNIVFVLEVKTE